MSIVPPPGTPREPTNILSAFICCCSLLCCCLLPNGRAMAVPQLQFKDCELDAITLSWERAEGTGYKLEFREILVSDWAGCRSIAIAPEQSSSTEMSTKVTGLNPSSSYIFRLYTVTADGQEVGPGPEIAFDTEVVSCAPTNKSCCTIS